MVNHRKQHTRRKAAKQGVPDNTPGPNRISACTPYDFHGKNLTPYGGLLPVATMLLSRHPSRTAAIQSGTVRPTRRHYEFISVANCGALNTRTPPRLPLAAKRPLPLHVVDLD